jgi:cobalt-zinc-cadmium efflux system protein
MHTHSHAADHCHCATPSNPEQIRALRIALVLVASFSAAELWVSLHSHSLSLMADAGHLVADVFAIALALWTAQRTSDPLRSAERERLNAIAALVNGSLLLLVAGWLGWEAIAQLRLPSSEILTRPVVITALVGLGVNALNAYLLHAHADDNLNLKGAFLHMLADAGSCLGVLVGALLIAKLGWFRADGVVSSAIALLILTGAIPLIRQSWASLNPSPTQTSHEMPNKTM